MLLDLCETVKPSLTLVDAVISMEGDGPSSGNPRETNFTFCSDSPYELDEYLCRFIGRDPKEIATVRLARERGLCPDFEKIIYQGESFSPVNLCPPSTKKQLDFLNYLPRGLRPAAKKAVEAFLSPRPEIDRKSCVGCGKCAESCPAHTIRVQDGKAEILRENCIKCYCCHEMCPIHAVTIRRSRILRL